jgi:hypothetical protein
MQNFQNKWKRGGKQANWLLSGGKRLCSRPNSLKVLLVLKVL